MAHITIFTLYRIEAGELETCITITMSYFVYLTCEAVEASGVIGVVLLGLTLNMHRACFSASALHVSEQTWQFLSYVANALIFLTVGVILLKTHSGNDEMLFFLSSIPHLLLVYIILTIVRAIMILSVHFFLKQIAYGFTWKDSIVTIWSGLRGGVSLVLALTLFNSRIKEKYQAEIMLIHTIAIVFLTCTGKRFEKVIFVFVCIVDVRSQCTNHSEYYSYSSFGSNFGINQTNHVASDSRSENRTKSTDWIFEKKSHSSYC